MRTAVAILVIVALVFLAVGAVNHAATLDLDFLAISWSGVSLFWVTVVLACVVVAAGLVGAWAARGSAVAAQRRLEKELAQTYRRLREAQAVAGTTAAAAEATVVATAVEEATAVAALEPPAPYEAEAPAGGPVDVSYWADAAPTVDAPRDVAAEVTAVTVVTAGAEGTGQEPAAPPAAEADEAEVERELTAVTVLTPAPDFAAVPEEPTSSSVADDDVAAEALTAGAPVEPEGSGEPAPEGPLAGDASVEQTDATPR